MVDDGLVPLDRYAAAVKREVAADDGSMNGIPTAIGCYRAVGGIQDAVEVIPATIKGHVAAHASDRKRRDGEAGVSRLTVRAAAPIKGDVAALSDHVTGDVVAATL